MLLQKLRYKSSLSVRSNEFWPVLYCSLLTSNGRLSKTTWKTELQYQTKTKRKHPWCDLYCREHIYFRGVSNTCNEQFKVACSMPIISYIGRPTYCTCDSVKFFGRKRSYNQVITLTNDFTDQKGSKVVVIVLETLYYVSTSFSSANPAISSKGTTPGKN